MAEFQQRLRSRGKDEIDHLINIVPAELNLAPHIPPKYAHIIIKNSFYADQLIAELLHQLFQLILHLAVQHTCRIASIDHALPVACHSWFPSVYCHRHGNGTLICRLNLLLRDRCILQETLENIMVSRRLFPLFSFLFTLFYCIFHLLPVFARCHTAVFAECADHRRLIDKSIVIGNLRQRCAAVHFLYGMRQAHLRHVLPE